LAKRTTTINWTLGPTGGLCSLLEAPEGEILKIVEIRGGQGFTAGYWLLVFILVTLLLWK